MAIYLKNEPTANILMNSMRSMGYSFESAIADIIDNSISAIADSIVISFPTDEDECFISIFDNGVGMSDNELFDAMKYGSEQKIHNRNTTDLGRFGLGLKSASLSQCKKLSVISKKNNIISAYIWDLEHINQVKSWDILKCEDNEISLIPNYNLLNDVDSGTVVVWQNFDTFKKTDINVFDALSNLKEPLYKYISLIFHRFISDGITFKINNRIIENLDPFLENHNKTNIQRNIEIPLKDLEGEEHIVVATPYILPYQTDMSKDDIKKVGGIDDYRSKQGFYIYRNNRLIIWGTWFGYKKHELTKNARIKIDIPNTLDDIWKIDIKKQNATIPPKIKKQLKKAILDTMGKAKKVQTHRGRVANKDNDIDFVWNRLELREEKVTYSINRDSIIFDDLKSNIDDSTWKQFETVLMAIEQTLPSQQIYVDKAENNIDDKQNDIETNNELISFGLLICSKHKDKTTDELIEILSKIDLFRNNIEVLNNIKERL